MDKNKLIKQILRICEKQYRKGFQQGYYASVDYTINLTDVNKFREHGSKHNYKNCIDPINGKTKDQRHLILAEISMDDMDELRRLLMDTI